MLAKWRFFAATLSVLFQLGYLASATVGFKPAHAYSVGTAPSAVAVADFNGDGTTDIAVCNFGDPASGDHGNVSILLGRGAQGKQLSRSMRTPQELRIQRPSVPIGGWL